MKKHAIITVHGIRTYGRWQDRLEKILESDADAKEIEFDFLNYTYGFFTLFSFIVPFLRKIAVARFRSQLLHGLELSKYDRVDIVAHSFGTYLATNALLHEESQENVRINSLVLCGSVLSPDTNISKICGENRPVQRIINECGTRDGVLLLTLLVFGVGMAGRLGLHGFQSSRFQNRYFDLGHSGYFLGKDDDNHFMRKHWAPLLLEDAPIARHDSRPASPSLSERVIRTLGENGAAFTVSIYGIIVSVIGGVFAYLWLDASQNEKLAVARANELSIETIKATSHLGANLYRAGDTIGALRVFLDAWSLIETHRAEFRAPENWNGWIDPKMAARRATAMAVQLESPENLLREFEGKTFVWLGSTYLSERNTIKKLEDWAAVYAARTYDNSTQINLSETGLLSVWHMGTRIYEADTRINSEPTIHVSSDGETALLLGTHYGPTGGSTYEVVKTIPLTSNSKEYWMHLEKKEANQDSYPDEETYFAMQEAEAEAVREQLRALLGVYDFFSIDAHEVWHVPDSIGPDPQFEPVSTLKYPSLKTKYEPDSTAGEGIPSEGMPNPKAVDQLKSDETKILANMLAWARANEERWMSDSNDDWEVIKHYPQIENHADYIKQGAEDPWFQNHPLWYYSELVKKGDKLVALTVENIGNAGRSEYSCVQISPNMPRCAYLTGNTNEQYFYNRTLPIFSDDGSFLLALSGGDNQEGIEAFSIEEDLIAFSSVPIRGKPDADIIDGDLTSEASKMLAVSTRQAFIFECVGMGGCEREGQISPPDGNRFLAGRFLNDDTVVVITQDEPPSHLYGSVDLYDVEQLLRLPSKAISVSAVAIESGIASWTTELAEGDAPPLVLSPYFGEPWTPNLAVSATAGLVAAYGYDKVHVLDAQTGLFLGWLPLPDYVQETTVLTQDRLGFWFVGQSEECEQPCLHVRGRNIPLFREMDANFNLDRLRAKLSLPVQ
ncbi:hypothetical protein [Ruegeria sp. AD91A]|uniref:hypothetical protein n=1 Tax=Ruegeria sp. AD91A TaxID=2293862 RepID=UPI0013C2C043|nr:hypothetical protein [Ruegeria sp. AD91A]